MQNAKIGLNIYITLLLACALLELTIVSGFILTLFRAIIFAWSLYYFLRTIANTKKEPAIIVALAVFYLLLAIYGIIVVFEGKSFAIGSRATQKVVTLSYIVKVSWSLLPIFVFYNFARKGILTKQVMIRWLPIFFAAAIVCYFIMRIIVMEKHDEDEVTNNGGYLILSLVPMLLFLKAKSFKQYLFLAGSLLLIFLSMKRGAILIGLVIIVIYYLYLFRDSKRSSYVGVVLALVVGLSSAYYLFDRMLTSSEYFQQRLDETLEGDTNGRDFIQGFFINYYFNEYTPKEQLIGKGANSTLELFNFYAHCDWIELAINQGLIGMLLYFVFWITFIKLLFKKKIAPDVRTCLIMLFFIYFMKTIFSMSYSEYTLYSSMALGYCIAMSYQIGDKKRIVHLKSRRNEKSNIHHLGRAL